MQLLDSQLPVVLFAACLSAVVVPSCRFARCLLDKGVGRAIVRLTFCRDVDIGWSRVWDETVCVLEEGSSFEW